MFSIYVIAAGTSPTWKAKEAACGGSYNLIVAEIRRLQDDAVGYVLLVLEQNGKEKLVSATVEAYEDAEPIFGFIRQDAPAISDELIAGALRQMPMPSRFRFEPSAADVRTALRYQVITRLEGAARILNDLKAKHDHLQGPPYPEHLRFARAAGTYLDQELGVARSPERIEKCCRVAILGLKKAAACKGIDPTVIAGALSQVENLAGTVELWKGLKSR